MNFIGQLSLQSLLIIFYLGSMFLLLFLMVKENISFKTKANLVPFILVSFSIILLKSSHEFNWPYFFRVAFLIFSFVCVIISLIIMYKVNMPELSKERKLITNILGIILLVLLLALSIIILIK